MGVLLPERLCFLQNYYLVLYGVLVVLLLAVCPDGLVGLAERLLRRLRPAPAIKKPTS